MFHLRLEAAQQHPLLQRHVDIMQRLGPDGMSSDESDVEDGRGGEDPANPTRPIFRVVAPGWRAREVGEWLEPFDAIHLFPAVTATISAASILDFAYAPHVLSIVLRGPSKTSPSMPTIQRGLSNKPRPISPFAPLINVTNSSMTIGCSGELLLFSSSHW